MLVSADIKPATLVSYQEWKTDTWTGLVLSMCHTFHEACSTVATFHHFLSNLVLQESKEFYFNMQKKFILLNVLQSYLKCKESVFMTLLWSTFYIDKS